MKKFLFCLGISLLAASHLKSQAGIDSTQKEVLEYATFLGQVLETHPLAVQANLNPAEGEALLRAARGNFDPVLGGSFEQKSFDGKNYFTSLNSGLTIPTTMGVKFFGDYQRANGIYLNPEETVPEAGLAAAGVEVNLGKGFLIDKRRAELQKARIYSQSLMAEREVMLNELVYLATEKYWNWVRRYQELQIYQMAAKLATDRFEGVVQSFFQGDKAAIDTTEALIQVQVRTFAVNEARIKLNEARLELSNFLWNEEGKPLELRRNVPAPELTSFENPERPPRLGGVETLLEAHPQIRVYDLKLAALDVERRYKIEQLKPKLAFKYNFLSGANQIYNPQLQNYKMGVDLAFPLFLRTARGELAQTNIDIQRNRQELNRKRWEISNKIHSILLKLEITAQQIELYKRTVVNYEKLVAGEAAKFENGESSLFVVNTREQNLVKADLEFIRQATDYPILKSKLYMISGGFFELVR